ncbi:MAG TPA: ATP-binding protein [Polyangia bacterium]|nr:ATP-binding protein [Polyangia bacterium]
MSKPAQRTPPRPELPEYVRRLLDGSVDAAVVLDSDRRPLYWNTAYQQYTGLRPRQLAQMAEDERGKCCYHLFPIEVCESMCLGRKAFELGRPVRMDEIHARRADGEELTLIVTATPIPGHMVIETYRDVTADARIQNKYKLLLEHERQAKELLEQKVAERTVALERINEELKRAQAQLIHQEKMSSLGRLIAGIAHELNNPINFVYGNVEFLARYFEDLIDLVTLYDQAPLLPELKKRIEQRKHEIEYDFLRADSDKLLRSIRSGAERTANIVRDLKAFSRVGSGQLQEFSLADGIDTTLNLIAPLIKNRIQVRRDYAPEAPKVFCHVGHINQVFMNVLTNAAQAIRGEGQIFIQIRSLPGERVQVRVTDTGPGVAGEIREKIFDPFFTTKEVGEGTGLGLTISEGIVRNHGGRITVEGELGQGATFVIELPVRPPEHVLAGEGR